jgi:hypothetical protein
MTETERNVVNEVLDFRSWHEADQAVALIKVCCWGTNGRGPFAFEVLLLPRNGPADAIARCLLEGRADQSEHSAMDSSIARVASCALPKFAFAPNWNQPPPPALLVQATVRRKV